MIKAPDISGEQVSWTTQVRQLNFFRSLKFLFTFISETRDEDRWNHKMIIKIGHFLPQQSSAVEVDVCDISLSEVEGQNDVMRYITLKALDERKISLLDIDENVFSMSKGELLPNSWTGSSVI